MKVVVGIIFLAIQVTVLFAQKKLPEDSLLCYAATGRVVVYDTLMQPIPLDSLPHFFYNYDTIVNCAWTRPSFVDNFYLDGLDGVRWKSLKNFEKRKSPHSKRSFELYHLLNYDRHGNFINEVPAFYVSRSPKPVSKSEVLMAEVVSLGSRKEDYAKYKLLTTDGTKSWRNQGITIGTEIYDFDSCQYKYQLKLNPDLTFTQNYDGYLECFTPEMYWDEDAGVEGSMEYAYVLQICSIEHGQGIWTVRGNQFILKSEWGVPFLYLHFQIVDGNTIVFMNGSGQKNTLDRVLD